MSAPPVPGRFEFASDFERDLTLKIEKEQPGLQTVFGWAMVAVEKDGRYYIDTQGTYLSASLILRSATKFMRLSRKSDDRHDEKTVGEVVFAWPFFDAFKAFGLPDKKRGLAVGVQYDDKSIFDKFLSGEYTGFSTGGWATAKMLADGVCPECEKPEAECHCMENGT